MKNVTFATTQFSATDNRDENISIAEDLVTKAAEDGAQVILLQELFAGFYWCQAQDPKYFDWAESLRESVVIQHFSALAKKLSVVLPISYFEKAGNAFFNSLVMIDADGRVLENYRKSHIPDGPGYQEKFYFSPGNSGFKVWPTKYGIFGAAICWDQWFPEAARVLALKGAEAIFYPTAIGSEPHDSTIDSCAHWQRVMQGHSAANMVPVIASNRIGCEVFGTSEITFYGSSFITNEFGEKVVELNRSELGVALATIDLETARRNRQAWGIFRDRRPELYHRLLDY